MAQYEQTRVSWPRIAALSNPIRVLLWLPTVTYFGSLLRIAKVLRQSGIAEPIIHAPVYFPGAAELQSQAFDSGIPYLCFMKPDLSGYFDEKEHIRKLPLQLTPVPRQVRTADYHKIMAITSWLKSLALRRIYGRIWQDRYLKSFLYWKRLNIVLLDNADFLIDYLGIDIFITPDETIDYNSQYFLASMRCVEKRSILIPLAVPSTDEVDDVLIKDKNYHVIDECQRGFARLFPKWIRTVDGRSMTRVPLGKATAVETDGLSPRYPWLSFTLGSDIVGLNSEYLRDRFVELGGGYRRNRMLLIGSPEDDDVARAKLNAPNLRRELAQLFNWKDERPIVLVNPVGDFCGQYRLPEFGTYYDLLKFWVTSLKDFTNFHVVITPHPSFRFAEQARKILEEMTTNIVWRRASDLIPVCDLYMSYGGSSTLRLAAAAGLPVLNYMCYDFNIPPQDAKSYFIGFDSIVVARNSVQLKAAVQHLNDLEKFYQLTDTAKQAAAYFGTQRGDFADRLTTVVNSLACGSGELTGHDVRELRDWVESSKVSFQSRGV